MPKLVDVEGQLYEFPDDATNDEITELINQKHPAQTSAPEGSSATPLGAVAVPAVLAAQGIRPALNVVGNKLATGTGETALRMAGRIAGGSLGSAIGGSLGLGAGGPLGGFSGAGAGVYAGSTVGGQVARKMSQGLKGAGQMLADATATTNVPSVRAKTAEEAAKWGAKAGQFIPGELPVGRRLVGLLGKAVPAMDRASMVSALYDQQPSEPGEGFLQSLIRKTPGVLKDPLGVGTGAAYLPKSDLPPDHVYTKEDYDFPVDHYKEQLTDTYHKLLQLLVSRE